MKHNQRLICGALFLAMAAAFQGATQAQQAPAEKPHCKAGELEKEGKCVPKLPQVGDPGIVWQAPAENPLPRCKESEVLKNGKCVPKN